jgi:methyl-accepting chemotaxis protein
MATNIGGVSAAANETGAADLVLTAASNLWKQTERLSGEVTTFFAGVRAA